MRSLSKSLVFMVLSCFILVSLVSVPVAMAATTVTVEIGEVTGIQGSPVTVPITIDTTGDITDNSVRAFNFDIIYDRTKLSFVNATSPIIGVELEANNDAVVNSTTVLRVAYFNMKQTTLPDGIIVNLNFNIIDTGAVNQQKVDITWNSAPSLSAGKDITIDSVVNTPGSVTIQVIPVESITVAGAGGATTITTDKGTLQMEATVSPDNAANKAVTWSVENGTGSAMIDANGLLTATGNGTVTVKATANDGSGIVGQTVITISGQLLPPSAGLTDPFFVLSAGNDTVTPQRAQTTTQYQAEVDYTVDTITVTPTAAVGTIKVNGNVVASGAASGAINLNVGANPITITVQEDGKAAKTYTITVTRLAANANANLSSLTLDNGTLAPAFDPATTSYTVDLSFGSAIPVVSAITADPNATVSITQATNLSGTIAERTATVVVTAQDGTTKKTYKVIFEVAKQFTVTANKTTVGNRQHVTVNVTNAGDATNATIILALYDTSTANVTDMKALIFKEGSIASGNNSGILTGGFIVPTNYTIKAFVWDDFNSQKALSDVAIP